MGAATGFLHTLYFFQIFFNLATGVTKLAMYVAHLSSTHHIGVESSLKRLIIFRLAFYRRIFPVVELKRVLLGVTAVVLLYTVAFAALNIFQWYVSSDLGIPPALTDVSAIPFEGIGNRGSLAIA